jgi:glycerol-3-phosphate dehydrogenase
MCHSNRDVSQLVDREFDLLVIGAGINGACVARDAARRGLSVAIVDRSDIGSVTSFNSLRTVHGGLRYLQHLDFKRMRESIRERSNWLRVAPHLVHPLPFIAATSRKLARSKLAFRIAFTLNDAVGFDRNKGLDPTRRIPPGKLLTRDEALPLYPGSDAGAITGAACWHDAQMYDSERLALAVLKDAVHNGCVVGNYVAVHALNVSDGRGAGASASDVIKGGAPFDIRAKTTVITAGPLVDKLIDAARIDAARNDATTGDRPARTPLRLSKAMNILTRRIAGDHAVGVPSQYRDPNSTVDHGTRLLFITPWRDLSLIGTTHFDYDGKPEDFRVTHDDVQQFVNEINEACPDASLTLDDVRFVFAGLLPADEPRPSDSETRLLQHHRIIDHGPVDRLANLFSLVGVKYTTSRLAAQQTIDRVCEKLGGSFRPCDTSQTPVGGGDIADLSRFDADILARWEGIADPGSLQHLIRLYGSETENVLVLCEPPEGKHIEPEAMLAAQTRFAVEREYAVRLSDVVYRRADLAATGLPDDDTLLSVAKMMAGTLGWDDATIESEIDAVKRCANGWRADEGYMPLAQTPDPQTPDPQTEVNGPKTK